jgi:CRP/FNR family transcriptional regulator, cyclic AMP receptor protein
MGIRAVFINAKEQREVVAGEAVFAEGDTGAEMYGLISGAVELRKGEQSLGVLEPGDTFGELAIVSEAPRSLTAVATEPSFWPSSTTRLSCSSCTRRRPSRSR